VFELKIVGTLTLDPAASFDSTTLTPPINPPPPLLGGTTLPSVGGGTGTFSVDSASGSLLTGASIPDIAANQFPIEWQTSGEAKTRNVLLKNPRRRPCTPPHPTDCVPRASASSARSPMPARLTAIAISRPPRAGSSR
jgi:hypothetical protein